jgi:thioredoxin 1
MPAQSCDNANLHSRQRLQRTLKRASQAPLFFASIDAFRCMPPHIASIPCGMFHQTTCRRNDMSEHIHYVTDDNFDAEVLQSPTPVLVDYWAEWCGPCKMIAPILDDIAKEYTGRLKIAKLNIDENPGTPPKYGIRGIPTLMLFKNGNVEATKVGAVSKSQLAAFIDSNI